ncbi:MAG: FecR family protein [Parvibaculales bacterium]
MSKTYIGENLTRFSRNALRLSTAAALCLAPMLSQADAATKVGVTSAVIPQAMIGDTPGELKTVMVGDQVDQDVLIETGTRGRTQVLFVDGSSMNIGPNSRIVIDEFVFDASQLSGNLGARIEKGSMRFIGGVLSKRANQVQFDAGEATVGIRGGIAKVALEESGKLKAELVHGKLSVQTPEGLFETDRIGTLIERDATGAVDSRAVTTEEKKSELDDEAKENLIIQEVETPTEVDETTASAPTTEAEPDVLAENPVENGLVEIDENGNLKSSDELAQIDPEAAKLIDDGAIAIDENGNINPTEKMLEVDPIAQKMFEEGMLEVDENGFLVPSANFDQNALYDEVAVEEPAIDLVSDATLKDFGYVEPTFIASEERKKQNLQTTEAVLKNDPTSAKLFELGQLEIDQNGFLKPSEKFDPMTVARAERSSRLNRKTFIDDGAAEKLMLQSGVFDTKITTRVVGRDLASDFYSAEVTKVVSADIVREDAINAIEKLAVSNGIALPDDVKTRNLDELVALGGALSTSDALTSRYRDGETAVTVPKVEIDTKDGEVVLRSLDETGDSIEVKADDFYTDLATGKVDSALASRIIAIESIEKFVDSGATNIGSTIDRGLDEQIVFVPEITKDVKVDTIDDIGKGAFIDGLNKDFIDEDVGTDLISLVDTNIVDAGRIYIEPEVDNEVPEEQETTAPSTTTVSRDEEIARTTIEDKKETEQVGQTNYYYFSLAGQRNPKGTTNWGDGNPLYWTAYNSRFREEDVAIHYSDKTFDIDVFAAYQSGDNQNGISFASNRNLGRVRDILAENNLSFKLAVTAVTTVAGVQNISQNVLSHSSQGMSAAHLQRLASSAGSSVTVCECDYIATGIWSTASFTDTALQNITYEHKGHWAIGAPLSSDTLRSLAKMQASFTGHAYGTATGAGGSSTGFGTVQVNLDFANPYSSANTWSLTNFTAGSVVSNLNASSVLTMRDGAYAGNTGNVSVDGALHGTYNSRSPGALQTGGTFSVNSSTYSVHGSFAAQATSITPSN